MNKAKLLVLVSMFMIGSHLFAESLQDFEGIWQGSCELQGTGQFTSLTFFIYQDGFSSVEQDFCSNTSCVDPAFKAAFKGCEVNAVQPGLSIDPLYLVILPLTAASIELLDSEFRSIYNVTANFTVDQLMTFDVPKELRIVKKQIAIERISEKLIRIGNVTNFFANGKRQVMTQLNGCEMSL